MKIEYRISLWNYTFYARIESLEEAVKEIVDAGYGVEIFPRWENVSNVASRVLVDLSNRENVEKLKVLFKGLKPSLHSGGVNNFGEHQRQIDVAAFIGGDVIVYHADYLRVSPGAMCAKVDFGYAREVVAYAKGKGVIAALENGPLEVLEESLAKIEGLKICFDTGHVLPQPQNIKDFVDRLRKDIVHLHLQDPLLQRDHLIPGTGLIKEEEWLYLFEALKEENFQGAGVFEIKPRYPLHSAQDGKRFLDKCIL